MNKSANFYCYKCSKTTKHLLASRDAITGFLCTNCHERFQPIKSFNGVNMAGNPTRAQAAAKRAENTAKTETKAKQSRAKASGKESVPTATEKVAETANNTIAALKEKLNISPIFKQSVPTNAPTTVPAVSYIPAQNGNGKAFQTTELQNRSTTPVATTNQSSLAVPNLDFQSFIPSDLINPSIPGATNEQLNHALEQYAAGTRLQQIYQAGFKYIQEVGKSYQDAEKAKQSLIKGDIQAIKTDEQLVRKDITQNEYKVALEQRSQSAEYLKQEQLKTQYAEKETTQLEQKLEAAHQKRDTEIDRLRQQTADIKQKYLTQTIQGQIS